jgi:hypothetical protein
VAVCLRIFASTVQAIFAREDADGHPTDDPITANRRTAS